MKFQDYFKIILEAKESKEISPAFVKDVLPVFKKKFPSIELKDVDFKDFSEIEYNRKVDKIEMVYRVYQLKDPNIDKKFVALTNKHNNREFYGLLFRYIRKERGLSESFSHVITRKIIGNKFSGSGFDIIKVIVHFKPQYISQSLLNI